MDEILNEVPMEDLTPSEPLCECKKCVIQRQIDTLLETECTCTYKDVEKTESYIDENEIEQIHTYTVKEVDVKCQRCVDSEKLKSTLDNYIQLEKANINEELWDVCTIVDGIIYTPVIEGDISKMDELDSRVAATEEAVLGLLVEGMNL